MLVPFQITISAVNVSLSKSCTNEDVFNDEFVNKIRKYIVEIVKRSRNKEFPHGEYVELGCSPRASISLYIASKAEALLNGRNYVIPKDVKTVIKDVMRHRFILSYRAKSDGITPEKIIDEILKLVKAP